MNNEKVLRIIAIFMINLIVSFPITYAEVTEGEGTTSLEITVKDIKITDTSDNEIEYFVPQDVLIDVILEIDMINVKSVSARFLFEGTRTGSCIPFPEVTRCRWYDVPYDLESESFNEEVIITVTDEDDNETSKTVTLTKNIPKDETKPTISNLKITNRINKEIEDWISGSALEGYVYVDITDSESGLDEDKVKADLSDLNIELDYSSASPRSCVDNNGGLRCRFNIMIKLDQSKTANLVFEAEDKAGNKESTTLSYNLKVDAVGPEVSDIESDIIYNDYSYVKEIENKFLVSFIEAGVGLDRRDVILDLSELGAGVIPATECENNICYWEDVAISVRNGIYKIKVSAETKDKLGNELVGSLEKEVKVDITSPIVEEIDVGAVAGSMPLIEGYIQTGNALRITAKVYEPTSLTASGDFSKFITDAEEVPGYCTQDGNYWECAWETGEIDKEGYIVNYLKFSFTDYVGNIELFEYPLIVFAAEEEEVDYWGYEVGYPSPDGVDMELIALYDPYIYFPVELESKGESNIWPLSVEIGNCVNEEGESYGAYLSSEFDNKPELFNYNTEEPGILPYEIYLKYTLERAEPPVDELPITCTLNIRTLVEEQRISQIETENITVEIPYYYNPLGTLDGSIQAEIDRVSNSWLVKGEFIDTFNNIFKFAKMICRFVNSYYSIVTAFTYIKAVFAGQCVLTQGISGCIESVETGGKITLAEAELHRIYNTYAFPWCKLLSCQMWPRKKGEASKVENFFLGRMRQAYTRQGYWGNVDPQHSLVLSAIYLCLPGVFYNLQKARVIDCQYVNCLKQSAYNVPLQMCTAQRSYGYCKFVWGEFFNLIPFAAAISYLSQNVRRALSHPLEAVGVSLTTTCELICKSPTGVFCGGCIVARNLNLLVDILCDLGIGKGCEPIWKELKVDDGICKGIIEEEVEEEEGEPVV